MKKKVALAALLLGVSVGLAVLLVLVGFGSAPGASATWACGDLVVKSGPDPVEDLTVIGQVCMTGHRSTNNVEVEFTATDSGDNSMLDEVHVCIRADEFGWIPPGNERKCVGGGEGHFGAEEMCPATGPCVVNIPLTGLSCGDTVHVQAHAATSDGQTAYGEEWKGNFDLYLYCCG